MDLRQAMIRYARRARARLALIRSVEWTLRALFWGLCAALVLVAVHRLFAAPLFLPAGPAALGAAVLLCGLVAAFVPRMTLLEAAAAVDQSAGWKERLSSALALPAVSHPMEHALVEDARARLHQNRPSRLFPFKAPREAKWSPLVAIALAGAFFLPTLDLFGVDAREEKKKKEKEQIEVAIEKLEQKKKELAQGAETSEKVKEAVKKMEELLQQLQASPPSEKKELMAELSKLSDEIKKMQDELSKSQALAEKIQKAAAKDKGDAGELGRLMREGKFKEALEELAKMQQALKEGKLTPEQREKLENQMKALKEQLGKDGSLSELEKRLAQAMKGMEQGDSEMMESLQESLEQMQQDMADAEALQQALQDLENLADALSKDQNRCPSCGKERKEGEGG